MNSFTATYTFFCKYDWHLTFVNLALFDFDFSSSRCLLKQLDNVRGKITLVFRLLNNQILLRFYITVP